MLRSVFTIITGSYSGLSSKYCMNIYLGGLVVDLRCHLDWAAFRAIAFLLLADNFSALALPPLSPPNLPRATAAGFFCGGSSFDSFVVSSTIALARILISSDCFLERLRMVIL